MARRAPQRRRPTRRYPIPRVPATSHRISGILGGGLLALGVLWLGWLLLHQLGGPALPGIPILNFAPTTPPNIQSPPLAAVGITLSQSNQTPTVKQQQALLIASQLEPDAATKAKSTTAQFVLLNYQNKGTPATHADFNNVPVWMVLYQKIPLPSADPAVDPTPLSHPSYDLYVFLDASSGKELLKIQL